MKKAFLFIFLMSSYGWSAPLLVDADDFPEAGTLYPTTSYDESVNPTEGAMTMKPDFQGADCEPNCKSKMLQNGDPSDQAAPTADSNGSTH